MTVYGIDRNLMMCTVVHFNIDCHRRQRIGIRIVINNYLDSTRQRKRVRITSTPICEIVGYQITRNQNAGGCKPGAEPSIVNIHIRQTRSTHQVMNQRWYAGNHPGDSGRRDVACTAERHTGVDDSVRRSATRKRFMCHLCDSPLLT